MSGKLLNNELLSRTAGKLRSGTCTLLMLQPGDVMDLKPCPFCGCVPTMKNVETEDGRCSVFVAPEINRMIDAATKALHYMRLHKYADQSWADDLEAAIGEVKGR